MPAPKPVYVLIWNWDLQRWEIWNERVLWKILQTVRRPKATWGDIE